MINSVGYLLVNAADPRDDAYEYKGVCDGTRCDGGTTHTAVAISPENCGLRSKCDSAELARP